MKKCESYIISILCYYFYHLGLVLFVLVLAFNILSSVNECLNSNMHTDPFLLFYILLDIIHLFVLVYFSTLFYMV